MSKSNQFFPEKWVKCYVKTPALLKEQAMTSLAVQLCQRSGLTKCIIQDFHRIFKRSRWPVSEWEIPIGDQFSAVCETLPLPRLFKVSLIYHIWLITYRLFEWNREYRIRFLGTSQIAIERLTLTDWTAEGRINKRLVAERLVRDEGLPLTQRYILSCIYIIEPFIQPLWNEISSVRKLISKFDRINRRSNFVMLWSNRMSRGMTGFIGYDNSFRKLVFEAAVEEGLRTAVVYCWNGLSESTKQEIIVKSACCAFTQYNILKERWGYSSKNWCSWPTHYSDILYFLVSQMSHGQVAQFFKFSLNLNRSADYSIDTTFTWALESPYQIYFMPIITKLWGILPEYSYLNLLKQLSERYSKLYHNEYKNYDYGNLLVELFHKTPDNYHRYIFSNSNWVDTVFIILDKRPFQHKNIEIIENMLRHATVKEKRSVMYSSSGEHIYYYLITSRNRDTLDLILSNCLSVKEVADFRKKLTLSYVGKKACFWILSHENGEVYVHSLLNWAYFSPEEISEFKPNLIWNVFKNNGLSINALMDHDYVKLGSQECGQFTWDPREAVTTLLEKFDTEGVDRVLEWCLPSEDDRKQYKDHFMSIIREETLNLYYPLNYNPNLECNLKCLMSKISQFLCWAFPSEEDRKLFKHNLFVIKFPQQVLKRSILHEQWQDVDLFVEYFELTAIEIKQLIKYVMWDIDTLYDILDLLYKSDSEAVSHYLRWGLSDSKTAKAFKEKFDEFLYTNEAIYRIRRDWNQLIKVRLSDLAINQVDEIHLRMRSFEDEIDPFIEINPFILINPSLIY